MLGGSFLRAGSARIVRERRTGVGEKEREGRERGREAHDGHLQRLQRLVEAVLVLPEEPRRIPLPASPFLRIQVEVPVPLILEEVREPVLHRPRHQLHPAHVVLRLLTAIPVFGPIEWQAEVEVPEGEVQGFGKLVVLVENADVGGEEVQPEKGDISRCLGAAENDVVHEVEEDDMQL